MTQIRQLHAAEASVTVATVTTDGAMDIDPKEVKIARVLARQSRRVTISVDRPWLGGFLVVPLGTPTQIVTAAMPWTLHGAVETTGARIEIVNL